LPASGAPLVLRKSGAMKALLATAALLAALFLGLLTLVMLGFSTGPLGMAVGIVLAVLPLPVYMMLALWIDRFEKEPVWMLAAAFLWGATGSVFFAFILNTGFAIATADVLGAHADLATAVISAPFVEELAKGLALVIFFLWKRDEFDNVLDGIIYAAMAGLGFAMTENILYYGKALAAGGLGASLFTFVLRGVVSPFAHPLFTSMTGIGLGIARQARKGSPLKWLAPIGGICLAMFLHFLWNFSASLGAMFFVAYVLVMVPTFSGIIAMVFISLAKEGKIIRAHLLPELSSGLLDEKGYLALGTVRGRLREARAAFSSGGLRRWRMRTRFQELASELAFHRWRTERGIYPRGETPAIREAGYVMRLATLHTQLGGTVSPQLRPSPIDPAAATGSAPMRDVVRQKTATAPRAGGVSGVAIALGSLGCLGVIVLGVIALAVGLYMIGSAADPDRSAASAGPVYEQPLATLMPANVGEARLAETELLDADTVSMFGAIEALQGTYAGKVSLLLLNYRSADLAAAALESVTLALFAPTAGWTSRAEERAGAAARIITEQQSTGTVVIARPHGSLLLIIKGEASGATEFDSLVVQQLAPPATENLE
jgi:RsiW-degrading membrane proteinase PrsW (M82 family)